MMKLGHTLGRKRRVLFLHARPTASSIKQRRTESSHASEIPPRPVAEARWNLETLPPEVILSIADHLPDLALMSFSLTCWDYRHLLRSKTQLIKIEKVDLAFALQKLEQEIPNKLFCWKCCQLHTWKPDDDYFSNDSRGFTMCLVNFTRYLPQPWMSIKYNCARLIMNRHRYGPEHGFLVDKLDYDKTYFRPWGVRMDFSCRARIIRDELFIKRTISLSVMGGHKLEALENGEKRALHFCSHLPSLAGMFTRERVPELENIVPCKDSLGSCRHCLTDYSVSVTRVERTLAHSGYWDVDIVIYQQLGTCYTPLDWKWAVPGRLSEVLGQRSEYKKRWAHERHGPGRVRRRWSRLDEEVPLGGKFVGRH